MLSPMRGTVATSVVPVGSVCLRMARALQGHDEDGEPLLVIRDGETAVELSPGLGGDGPSAARGAQRLAEALLRFASVIEAGTGPSVIEVDPGGAAIERGAGASGVGREAQQDRSGGS